MCRTFSGFSRTLTHYGRNVRIRPLRIAVIVFDVWLVAVVALAVFAVRDLRIGIADVGTARAGLTAQRLVAGDPAVAMRAAERRFSAASAKLDNPAMLPLRFLPVAGRQLRAASALSTAAEIVARTGARGIESAASALRDAPADGPGRVALVGRMGRIIDAARRDLAGVDAGPGRALVRPLAVRRATFVTQLDEARSSLVHASDAIVAVHSLLEGPSKYLVLAGNNAEMRAGSGAFLSVGMLDSSAGTLHLGDFQSAGDLLLPPPGPAMEHDLEARWGWLDPNREWRNLGVTPRFEVTGAMAASMWEARTGEKVDGVLAMDVAALKAVLRATGPVDVDGERVDADGVERLLMHDQYVDAGAQRSREQIARRERLGAIGSAAVNALEAGNFSVPDLTGALVEAAASRHVLIWGRETAAQRGWKAVGASGEVGGDGVLIAVINRGANKLDQFLAVENRMSTSRAGADTEVALAVTLDNKTPPGEIPYIAGPSPEAQTGEGEYRGLLSVTLPAAARAPKSDGTGFVVGGRDGPSSVVAVEVRIQRGETKTVTLRFTMPGAHGSLRQLPSARIPPVEWRRGANAFNDGLAHTLRW